MWDSMRLNDELDGVCGGRSKEKSPRSIWLPSFLRMASGYDDESSHVASSGVPSIQVFTLFLFKSFLFNIHLRPSSYQKTCL
jgi:hypothetical protein